MALVFDCRLHPPREEGGKETKVGTAPFFGRVDPFHPFRVRDLVEAVNGPGASNRSFYRMELRRSSASYSEENCQPVIFSLYVKSVKLPQGLSWNFFKFFEKMKTGVKFRKWIFSNVFEPLCSDTSLI